MSLYNCGKCAICNPRVFAEQFPRAFKKSRRSHDEVVLERKKKREAILARKEFYNKRRKEIEQRRLENAKRKIHKG